MRRAESNVGIRIALCTGIALALIAVSAIVAWTSNPTGEVTPVSRPTPTGHDSSPSEGEGGADADPAAIVERSRLDVGGPESDTHFVLTVVDAASNRPEPQAEVLFMTASAEPRYNDLPLAERRAWWRLGESVDGLLERYGRRTTTDHAGRAWLPEAEGPMLVFARAGDRSADRRIDFEFEPPAGGHVLQLELDRSFTVRVVDVSGTPLAGVPIELYYPLPKSGAHTSPLGETDDRGELAVYRAQGLDVRRVDGARSVRVYAQVVHGRPITAEVDLDRLPARPVNLVAPATGSVAVRLVDPFGSTLLPRFWSDGAESFRLSLETPDGDGGTATTHDEQARLSGDGWFRFEHVALGAELVAVAEFGMVTPMLRAPLRGPDPIGRLVTTTLSISDLAHIATGTAVDAAGEPIRERELVVTMFDGEDDVHCYAISDEHGRFWTAWSDDDFEGYQVERIEIESRDRNGRRTGERAAIVASPRMDERLIDLGTLTLRPLDTVLAGRMVDEDGRPLEQTSLTPLVVDGAEVTEVAHERVLHFGDGRFAVRGVLPERGRIRILAHRHPDTPAQEFAVGDTNATLHVVEAARFVARVHHGGVVEGGLQLAAHLESVRGDALDGHVFPASKSGWYQLYFSAIPRGRYDLVIHTEDDPRPAALIRGLVFDRGGLVEDERCRAIDVTGRVHRVTLTFRSEDGETLAVRGRFRILTGSDQDRPLRRFAGHIALSTTPRPFDVEIRPGSDFADVTVRSVVADQEIVLHRR